MGALMVSDLVSVEAEPRVADVVLGERLGLKIARNVRRFVERNRAELLRYGPLPTAEGFRARGARNPEAGERGFCGTAPRNPDGHELGFSPTTRRNLKADRGRTGTAYLLNEGQALLVCMFARTERAADVREQVIRVFMDWRRGGLPRAVANPASLTENQLAEARSRLAILSKAAALEAGGLSRTAAFAKVAAANGLVPATIWAWRRKVVHQPQDRWLGALAPAYTGGGKASPVADDIWELFRSAYLSSPRQTVIGAYAQAERAARAQGIDLPHKKTFERRLKAEAIQALRHHCDTAPSRRGIPVALASG